MNELIIDGNNALLGRLASYVAKQALNGKKVSVVNCSQIVVSGSPEFLRNHYQIKLGRGGNSLKGPIIPKNPERIVKRAIRGMLPYLQERGMNAFKRIRCYNETPLEYKDKPMLRAGKEKTIETTSLKALVKVI